MISKIKDKMCYILFLLLVVIVLLIFGNSVYEGFGRIVTQNMIDNTYKLHH